MVSVEQVMEVVSSSLGVEGEISATDANAPLLGALPEMDSMAIVGIIADLEEKFDIAFDDDELDAEVFETVGSLHGLIVSKLDE